jgi:Predicted O-methyltransferase
MNDFPDLRPHFSRYRWAPMPHSKGVEVGCDWGDKPDDWELAIYKRNGSLTLDETRILFECVQRMLGSWLDVGGGTGWTAAYMAAAGARSVTSIDVMYGNAEFLDRATENLLASMTSSEIVRIRHFPGTSDEYFAAHPDAKFAGVLVDGNHDAPIPERDALNAADRLSTPGVILFHDGFGDPVQAAVRALMRRGFLWRYYDTPQGLIACWQGLWEPPTYEQPDPAILQAARRHYARI